MAQVMGFDRTWYGFCSIEILDSPLALRKSVSASADLQLVHSIVWLTSASGKLGVFRACIDRDWWRAIQEEIVS